MTTPASPATVEELRAAQAKEYGDWVAVDPIDVGNARAFNVGDPVPASHPFANGAHPSVKRVTTKAAQAAADTAKEG